MTATKSRIDIEKLVDHENGLVDRTIFSDQAIYRQELEQIFARCWLVLGHESQLPKPGDYLTSWMGEDSVICAGRPTAN